MHGLGVAWCRQVALRLRMGGSLEKACPSCLTSWVCLVPHINTTPDFRGEGGRGGGGNPPTSAECSGLGVRRARGFLGAAFWHRGPLKVWPSILACRGLLRDQCVVRSGAVPCTNHSMFPHRCRRHSSAGKAAPRECLECVCVQHLANRLPCIQAEGFHESILACKERTACHQRGYCGALPSP